MQLLAQLAQLHYLWVNTGNSALTEGLLSLFQ